MVFKQESNYYEFFYKDLIPGLHYIPVKNDLSDLVDKIIWAKEHDEDGLKIVKSARQFARDNLLPRDILCYYTVLFHVCEKKSYFKYFFRSIFSSNNDFYISGME